MLLNPRREGGTWIVPYQDRSHGMTMERHAVAFFMRAKKSIFFLSHLGARPGSRKPTASRTGLAPKRLIDSQPPQAVVGFARIPTLR